MPELLRADDLAPEWRALLAAAREARQRAHAPYSRFQVGAAVRGASGRVFGGCNIENASYGLTVCAERVAVWQAVAAGEQRLSALVVVTADGSTPCGACRQVLHEFAAGELPVLIADTAGGGWFTTLAALLPHPFPQAHPTS
jgi:cytidine deaminase